MSGGVISSRMGMAKKHPMVGFGQWGFRTWRERRGSRMVVLPWPVDCICTKNWFASQSYPFGTNPKIIIVHMYQLGDVNTEPFT